jgi:hypothetical protein
MNSSYTSYACKENAVMFKNIRTTKARLEMGFDCENESLNAELIQNNTVVKGTSILVQNCKVYHFQAYPFKTFSTVCFPITLSGFQSMLICKIFQCIIMYTVKINYKYDFS